MQLALSVHCCSGMQRSPIDGVLRTSCTMPRKMQAMTRSAQCVVSVQLALSALVHMIISLVVL
jgi:hypothetical protein